MHHNSLIVFCIIHIANYSQNLVLSHFLAVIIVLMFELKRCINISKQMDGASFCMLSTWLSLNQNLLRILSSSAFKIVSVHVKYQPDCYVPLLIFYSDLMIVRFYASAWPPLIHAGTYTIQFKHHNKSVSFLEDDQILLFYSRLFSLKKKLRYWVSTLKI